MDGHVELDPRLTYINADRLSKIVINPAYKDELLKSERNGFVGHPALPTDYELAFMANEIYAESESRLENWQLVTVAESKTGYRGGIYWNAKTQQLVLAHRGTWTSGGFQVDIQTIVNDSYSKHAEDAMAFTDIALKLAIKLQCPISITGHSLGAWLASISALEAAKRGIHAHTVLIDSPGCKAKLRALNGIEPHLEQLDIKLYLSSPNLVNTCKEQLDVPTFRLYQEFPKWYKWSEYVKYLITSHSMVNLLALFQKDTGQPIPDKCRRVLRWPVVPWDKRDSTDESWTNFLTLLDDFSEADRREYQVFFELANNSNNYDAESGIRSFRDRFKLDWFSYETEDVAINQIPLHLFDKQTIGFLNMYQCLRDNIGINNLEYFNEYLIQNNLSYLHDMLMTFKIEGKVIKIIGFRPEDFTRYVKHLMLLKPEIQNVANKQFEILAPTYIAITKKLEQGLAKTSEEVESLKRERTGKPPILSSAPPRTTTFTVIDTEQPTATLENPMGVNRVGLEINNVPHGAKNANIEDLAKRIRDGDSTVFTVFRGRNLTHAKMTGPLNDKGTVINYLPENPKPPGGM